MNEKERLRELTAYDIFDTPPEKEMDEIAEIASAICDTPISIISFIDEKRQWFKAKVGLDTDEAIKEDSFCQHTLYKPKEILVVENPESDTRFKYNPHVIGNPNIKFYAGAPLVTPSGNVLGTLCIIDVVPKHISESQKRALQLLAARVMDYLNIRKALKDKKDEIKSNALKLKKLTDQAPGVLFQLEKNEEGRMFFSFMSEGIELLHPKLDLEKIMKTPELAFSVIHPDDIVYVKDALRKAFNNFTPWDVEYRVLNDDGTIRWNMGRANPEKLNDGTFAWYGTFQDITNRKEYEQTLEQIAFDISHVVRKPIASIMGFTNLIENGEHEEEKLKEYSGYIKKLAGELDTYTRKLSDVYNSKENKLHTPNAEKKYL